MRSEGELEGDADDAVGFCQTMSSLDSVHSKINFILNHF